MKPQKPLERLVKVSIPLSGTYPSPQDKKPYAIINSQKQIITPADLRTLYKKRQKKDNFSECTIFAAPAHIKDSEDETIAILNETPEENYKEFNYLDLGDDGRFMLPFDIGNVKKVYFECNGNSVNIKEYKEGND